MTRRKMEELKKGSVSSKEKEAIVKTTTSSDEKTSKPTAKKAGVTSFKGNSSLDVLVMNRTTRQIVQNVPSKGSLVFPAHSRVKLTVTYEDYEALKNSNLKVRILAGGK